MAELVATPPDVSVGVTSRDVSSAQCDVSQSHMEMLQSIQGALAVKNTTSQEQNASLQALNTTLQALNATLMAMKPSTQSGPEEKPESSHKSELIVLNPEVRKKFCRFIDRGNCNGLLQMIDDNTYPPELILLQGDCGETALHVAVQENSKQLVAKILAKWKCIMKHPSSNDIVATARGFPFLLSQYYNLSAFDMAIIVANEKLLTLLQVFITISKELQEKGRIDSYEDVPEVCDEEPDDEILEIRDQLITLLNMSISFPPNSEGIDWAERHLKNWSSSSRWESGSWGHAIFGADKEKYAPEECLLTVVKLDLRFDILSPEDGLTQVPFYCAFLKLLQDHSLLTSILRVRGKYGETVLHCCVNSSSSTMQRELLKRLVDFPNVDPNVTDFMGRTPLHWAAALGKIQAVNMLLGNDKTNINAVFPTQCNLLFWFIDTIRELKAIEVVGDHYEKCNVSLVKYVTPLHLATIHNHVGVVEALLKFPKLDVNAQGNNLSSNFWILTPTLLTWSALKLATRLGHVQIMRLLLKDPRTNDCGLLKWKASVLGDPERSLSALHIAAMYSQPLAIKVLVEGGLIDVFVRDDEGNTALHSSAEVAGLKLDMQKNLLEYIHPDHYFMQSSTTMRSRTEDDIITCMAILMDAGLTMSQKNKRGETPSLPQSTPPSVQQMWLKKMATEAQETKNNLCIAANAISVTAALVATASFVGPLQPPLGLSSNENPAWATGYSRVNYAAVNVFFICDCFSFYLAIASIVFALLPSLSILLEGVVQEVRIARRCVQVAVVLLFGSIVFVICAFSAALVEILSYVTSL